MLHRGMSFKVEWLSNVFKEAPNQRSFSKVFEEAPTCSFSKGGLT